MKLNDVEISTELLTNKVKVCLSTLGLNERYNAFQYLTDILVDMIEKDDVPATLHKSIKNIQQKYNIGKHAVYYGLDCMFKKTNIEKLMNDAQIQPTCSAVLNKIRAIKHYILTTLSNLHD